MTPAPLLSASLTLAYAGRAPALQDFALDITAGELVALAGESGGGKSTFSLALLGLHDRRQVSISGSIRFEGTELLTLAEPALRAIRGRRISLVPQAPIASLSPHLTVAAHLREAWRVHEPARGDSWLGASEPALTAVGLPTDDSFLRHKPAELSMGMAQRVLIAMAILHRPALLIADEPTSALDVIHQGEVLRLFRGLRDRMGMAMLFITHDLHAAASICDRVAILHQGRIVEQGPPARLFQHPKHAYTRALLAARYPSTGNDPR